MKERESHIETELRVIADALVREYQPEKIILFGYAGLGHATQRQ